MGCPSSSDVGEALVGQGAQPPQVTFIATRAQAGGEHWETWQSPHLPPVPASQQPDRSLALLARSCPGAGVWAGSQRGLQRDQESGPLYGVPFPGGLACPGAPWRPIAVLYF